MGLHFHNDYSKATVYLTCMLPDSGCAGGEFRKQGWWKIAYGDTVEVLSGDLTKVVAGGYFYFNAHGEDGSFWAGPYDTLVSNAKFNQCYSDDTGMTKNVGYREYNLPFVSNFTVTLYRKGASALRLADPMRYTHLVPDH